MSDQENYDRDQPWRLGGSPENSLDNNHDDRSLKDLDGEWFQEPTLSNNPLNIEENGVILRPVLREDDNSIEQLFFRAQASISRRNDITEFSQILEEVAARLGECSVDRLASMVNLMMTIDSSNYLEMSYLTHALIFTQKLVRFLEGMNNVELYRPVIAELLRNSVPFYSVTISEEQMQIVGLYLNCDEPEIHSLIMALSEHYNQERTEKPIGKLYDYMHQRVLSTSFRPEPLNLQATFLNCFIISKSRLEQKAAFELENNHVAITIEDMGTLEKKDLQEYCSMAVDMAVGNERSVEWLLSKVVGWLLEQRGPMERKMQGFRVLSDLVERSKNRSWLGQVMLQWLAKERVVEKFLSDSTHARILQQLLPILHFLYDADRLDNNFLAELTRQSLHSEDIFKVVQSMLGWLKLQHLVDAYELLTQHPQRDSPLFTHFLSALIANPALSGPSSRRRKNFIIQDNRRHDDLDIEHEQLDERASNLVRRLFCFLVELALAHQSAFMPILMKLIATHLRLLGSEIETNVLSLLRRNASCSLWILQHFLRLETSQERGGQSKYELTGRLAAEGVWELILAVLARHRFSRTVVEKGLSVIILLCRYQKPLERAVAEFLWKVLGLTGREEREREQFFVFLKQLVRFEGAVSEDSVNYIFFELLLSLGAEWFSLRVYDCLEMLFLRLNEDCKLLTFENGHYVGRDSHLIGLDKFWYIYFNVNDLKVIRRTRDFLWRIAAHAHPDYHQKILDQVIIQLRRYLNAALALDNHPLKQQVLLLRGFEAIEKMLQVREGKEDDKEGMITLHIDNTSFECLGDRKKTVEVPQNWTLGEMRQYIAANLNPPLKKIDILNKGRILKGQNLILRELHLESNETFTIARSDSDQTLSAAAKQDQKRIHLESLTNMFAGEHSIQFLSYVIDKYEGEDIDTIVNYLFDPERLQTLKDQYANSRELDEKPENSNQNRPLRFAELISSHTSTLDLCLNCLSVTQNRSHSWTLLKRLPLNAEYARSAEIHIESGDWVQLFRGFSVEQRMYFVHVLNSFVKRSPSQKALLFEEKHLGQYLLSWLTEVIAHDGNLDHHEDLLQLLLLSLDCPVLAYYETFMTDKRTEEEDKLLEHLQLTPYSPPRQDCQLQDLTAKLIRYISTHTHKVSERTAGLVAKIYLYQLNCNEQPFMLFVCDNLSSLLLTYGLPILYISAATAHYLSRGNVNDLSRQAHRLLNEFQEEQNRRPNWHYGALFSCINFLLASSLSPLCEQFISIHSILRTIRDRINDLGEEQLVGYLKLAQRLLKRHNDLLDGYDRALEESSFWLFKDYLFGLANPLPHFKSKNVRTAAYQLVLGLAENDSIHRIISREVKKVVEHFGGSGKEEGDFRTGEFVGLRNLGATCYINSVIQQLHHTILPKLLLEEDRNPSDPIKMLEFKKLFVHLYKGARSPVSTKEFVSNLRIGGEVVRPLVQQDANEFYSEMLHLVENDLGALGKTAIRETFMGAVENEIHSLEDRSMLSKVEESFLTLMIEMKGKRNLGEALSALTRSHALEGENIYYSESLGRNVRAASKISLAKLPNILALTLKRFFWNFEANSRFKINDYFEFPLELDLSRYTLPRHDSEARPPHYRLCGILIHQGFAESGHYFSYIRVGERWLEFNDKKVSEWDIAANLKSECFGGAEERSRNAYMLFYERVNSHVHGCALHQLPPDNRLMQLVDQENQGFVFNRLLTDRHFSDFIKQLAAIQPLSAPAFLEYLGARLNLPPEQPMTIEALDIPPIPSDDKLKKFVGEYLDREIEVDDFPHPRGDFEEMLADMEQRN